MKEQIIEQLTAVINALDSIAVTGQQNRGNLYGSIETLRAIVQTLSSAEFAAPENDGEECK